MSSRVTLVIPTRNRPAFLRRQLSYYRQAGFAGAVVLADSSDNDMFEATSQWIGTFNRDFSVSHVHLPGLSFAGAIREIRGAVGSPYVAVVPDDDFLVPSTIDQCADLLDQRSNCVAARGLGVLILSSDGQWDTVDAAGPYPQPPLVGARAADRVVNHLRAYSVTLFATHRTGPWAKAFAATPSAKDVPLCCDRSFSDELLQCSLTAAYGEIATIDRLYLVRQHHLARNFLDPWYRWLTDEKWRPSLIWFRDHVASAIAEVDSVSLEAAREAVDTGLSAYLRRALLKGVEAAPSKTRRVRRVVQRWLPDGAMAVGRRLRSRLASDHISLEGLLDPRSPYHQDFLPIYKAVTNS